MILRWRKREDHLAVAETNEADFLAFKIFLDHEIGAELFDGFLRLTAVARDCHAFACCESVCFNYLRKPQASLQQKALLLNEAELGGFCGWDSRTLKELLGEDFGPFKPCGGPSWTDDLKIALAESGRRRCLQVAPQDRR